MESYLNNNKNIFKKKDTSNIIYNIIQDGEPQYIFNYFALLIIFIFVFSHININYNILVGLIFCSILIYYLYTYTENNVLATNEIKKEKFDSIYPTRNILKKYDKIIDLLYYMQSYKRNNIYKFNTLIEYFENFCSLYENCVLNNSLINKNFQKLVNFKIIILNHLNSFLFTTHSSKFENKLLKIRKSAENLLNELLNNLVILHKQLIYYNGYNINTNVIDYSSILPYNITDDNNNVITTNIYNKSNLITF